MRPASDTTDSSHIGLPLRRSSRDGTANGQGVYNYEPIRDAGEIRLLKFRPGKPGAMIKADIEAVRLRGPHSYDAISYTWADENGDVTKCCSLRIGDDGLLLPVTRNCESVLRRVRKYTDTVWIDAVCINQQDIRERGKQVDLMPEIYTGASRTFAYVGEGSEDGETVLRNLAGGIWTPPCLLEAFFRRPYFSRVWVVQEVALSSRIIMMCGDTAVNWTGSMLNRQLRRIYTRSYYETFPTLFQLEKRHSSRSATAWDALVLGRRCDASDSRDRVYGIMGLVSANTRLPADYSLSTAEVYTQMVTHYYRAHMWRLDTIIGSLCYRDGEARARTPNLPSWVPDWNESGPTLLQRLPRAGAFLQDQDATFRDNDGTGLYLRGIMVGTLDALMKTKYTRTNIYLSNSRARGPTRLPAAYKDNSVLVFATEPRIHDMPEWDPDLGARWRTPMSTQDESNLFFYAKSGTLKIIHAFLVAGVRGGGKAEAHPSERCMGKAQEKPGPVGIDDPSTFELLGLVEIQVEGTVDENATTDPLVHAAATGRTPVLRGKRLDQGRENATYTEGPYTIRIV